MGTQNTIDTDRINTVVVAGEVTSEPVVRELASGATVVQFDLNTPIDGSNVSVPVAWHDPTVAQQTAIARGVHLVVVGSVRRRFFRVGGRTQSRTEVIAATVIPARRTKSVRSALTAVSDALLAQR
ncbi:MAG: single-stranded DNA-binding protein [Ilumatobacter sp.]|uniref:single-stranded DNA-binding protein n=1 Tax=Ilumatobacter sp. TaxID=1967498 RepID=UPI003298FEBF